MYHEEHEGHEELFLYLTQSCKGLKKSMKRFCVFVCFFAPLRYVYVVFFFVIFVV